MIFLSFLFRQKSISNLCALNPQVEKIPYRTAWVEEKAEGLTVSSWAEPAGGAQQGSGELGNQCLKPLGGPGLPVAGEPPPGPASRGGLQHSTNPTSCPLLGAQIKGSLRKRPLAWAPSCAGASEPHLLQSQVCLPTANPEEEGSPKALLIH